MASKEIAAVQSMQELQAAVQGEYKEMIEGIQSKLGAPAGNAIRITQNKKFVMPDGVETGGPIRAVIVGFTSRNVYYSGQYNPNAITSPDCYAEGDNPSALVPADDVETMQSEDCNSCPMNQFGSNGNGKACKNQRIVALLPPDDSDADIMTISVSPSALKGFDTYISKLATMYKVPAFAVSTEISFDPNETYAKVVFSNPEPNAAFKAYGDRSEEALTAVKASFAPAAETAANTPPVRGKGRR